MQTLSYKQQVKVTDTIIKAAVLMLEFGAESKLVELTANRVGRAFGVGSVEISMTSSAIVITTLNRDQSVTTTRSIHHSPINMSIVCDVQNIVVDLESNGRDVSFVERELKGVQPNCYNRWLVVLMIGFSCASFAYLNDADSGAFGITFLAAGVAMLVRQVLASKKTLLPINFCITAFVATIIASSAQIFNFSSTTNIALSSCILLLVPGFPLTNSMLDVIKGYPMMGWGRWVFALLLTLATSLGVILALSVLRMKGW
jgi:uncharacterized membrane protein YjjP (DUF1212 family)